MRVESVESQGHALAVEPCGAGGPGAAGRLRLSHDATGFRALLRTGRRPALWLLLPLVAVLSLPPAVVQAQSPSLRVQDASVEEGDSGITELEFEVTLDPPSNAEVTVQYLTRRLFLDDGAQGADFAQEGGTVTFAPGETSRTVSIGVYGDRVDEGEKERFLVDLSDPTGATIVRKTATLWILDDDDTPKVTLVLNTNTISENRGSATVTARLNHPSKEATVVTVSLSGWEGDWTQSGNRKLSIPAGSTTVSDYLRITALDNNIWVPDKKVTVSGTARNDVGIVNPDDVTLTIEDDGDTLLPSMAVRDAQLTEGDSGETDMGFRVDLSPATTLPVTFNVRTSEIDGLAESATSGQDYTAVNKNVTIAPGETGVTVSVPIIGDTVHELENEYFRLFGSTVGSDPPAYFRDHVGEGWIIDNDRPTMTLALSENRIREDGGVTTVTASLDRPSIKKTFVRISASAVSPAVKGDFTFGENRGLTILAGELSSTRTVTLTAVDNAVDVLFDKTVRVTGAARNERGIDNPEALTLTIVDDEVPVVTIAAETEEVIEERGDVTFIATRTEHDLSRSLAVNFLSNGGPSLPSGTITFAANETTARLGGSPWGDIDADGTVTITLQDGDGYELGAPSSASVTVRDITPVVTIAAETAEVVEEQGAVAFIVTRTELNLAESLTVNFLSSGGASLPSGTVTFPANETTARLGGSPWGDIDFDSTVRITLQDGDGYRLGTPSSASVTVRDEDVPVVTVAAETEYVYEEGEPVAFIFTRTEDEDLPRSLTVNYRVKHITGTFSSYALTFAANESSVRIGGEPAGNVNADGTVEITLRDGAGYRLGTPSSATVTVWDSIPTVSVADADAVTEGETVTFTLRRSGNLAQPLEAAYEVTATGDFGAATGAGAATFPANDAAVQVSVATTGDSVHEANGSVTLALTANAGVYKLRARSASTAAVLDDDDSPATGAVTIKGIAREGERLAANISGVEDADGLDNAAWTYQWVRTPPGGSGADISGATGATYVPVFADVGAALKVRVTVTDDEGHEAGFESAPTPAVAALPVVTVAAETEQVIEGGEAVAFIVTRTTDEYLSRSLTVNIQVTPVGGTEPTSMRITFRANQSTRRLGGSPAGDIDADGTSVLVLLDGDGYRLGTPSSATVTVWDSDFVPTVSVADADAVTEGETVTFTLTRSGNRVRTFTVAYETTSSGDFGAATGAGTATFPANDAAVQVSVATTDDSVHEAHGSVTLTLTADADAYKLGSQTASTAAVLDDDDSPATGAVAITGTAREGETLTADTSGVQDADGLDNAAWTYQWVRTPAGGSGADISGATGATYVPVFADAGATLKVRVTVTDDEGHEAAFESAPTAAVEALPRPSVTVASDGAVTEGEAVTFTLTRTGGHGGTTGMLDVAYMVTASGDFGAAAGAGTATIPANSAAVQVSVATTGDGAHEQHGSVTLTLAPNPEAYDLGAEAAATAAVLDDDNAAPTGAVTIDDATPVVGETLTADASNLDDPDGLANRSFTWQWLRVSGGTETAIAGATSASYTVVAADVGAALKVRVGFTDDDGAAETVESAPTSAVRAYTFEVTAPTVTEGGDGVTLLQFAVTRSDTARRMQLGWRLAASSTAQAGKGRGRDIGGPTQGTLNFPRGWTVSRFVVFQVIDDWIDESDETVVIEFFAVAGTPAGVTFPPTVTGTILDDDTSTVWIAPSRSVDEGDAGVTDLAFTVSMDNPSDREVTVAWDVSGTAEAGADYTAPAPALVTFPALSWASQKIVFGVIGDTDAERHETVTVALRDPTGGAVLGTSQATAEIRNDEELVLAVDPPEAVEGDRRSDRTRLIFGLTLTDLADTDVTVDYRVDAGASTATAGRDFKDKSGTVTIKSGQTFAAVRLGILEDMAVEPDETVVMVFENAQGALLDPASARVTGTILNDDLSQVTLAAKAGAVAEGEDAVFVLRRTGDASAPLTVTVDVSEAGSVLAGTAPTSATFGANETWTRLRVATADDAVEEADGSVTAALIAGSGYTVVPGSGSAAVAVLDNDGLSAATVVSIAAESGAVTEGGEAVFVLRRTGDASAPLTVAVDVSEAGSVLAGAAPASAVFGANETEARLRVATEDDAVDEADGRVTAAAVAGAGYTVAPGAGSAAVAVLDNDGPAAPGEPDPLWSTTMTVVAFGKAVGASGSDLPDRGWSEGGVDYRLDRLKWFGPPKNRVKVRFSRRPAAAGELTLRAGALSLPLAEGGSGKVFRWAVEGAPWPVGAEVELRLTRAAAGEDQDGAAGAGVSVADARADESSGLPLAFRVTLSEAQASAVSVRYATADGSAAAGADYVASSGVVRFEAGETVKTVHVAVLEDSHDEGEETMTLTLSHPFGARISDGAATGTIANTDAMPQAWLARFGRTVAGQVIDAVEVRMTAVRQAGVEVSIAGQRVGTAGTFDEAAFRGGGAAGGRLAGGLAGENGPEGLDMMASRDGALAGGRLAGWLAGGVDSEERTVSGRELLAGMSFARTEGTAESGFVSLWGRGVVTDFDGRDGELSVDGEVATGLLGADWARADWAAGLMVGHSRGEGSYRGQGAGTVSSSLTGLYPWGRRALNDRVMVWGVVGYGEGTLTLEPEGQARIETDMDLAMAAAGLRGVLVEAPAEGGFELAAKTDGLIVRSASDGAQGSDGGLLEAASAQVTRLRLGLEGTRVFRSEGGGTVTPSFGLGVRHDGGDAETGFGVEVGAGVAYADPSSGMTADLQGRGLLGHEASGFREVGFSGSLAFDPSPSSDRGLSLSLSQTVGASATGGVETLYGRDTMAGLGGADAGAGSVDSAGRRRLEARVGYGVSAIGGRFTGTPELGFGVSESGRDYRLGWRLTPAGGNAGAFEFSVEATRREAANDDGSEHGVSLRATIRW